MSKFITPIACVISFFMGLFVGVLQPAPAATQDKGEITTQCRTWKDGETRECDIYMPLTKHARFTLHQNGIEQFSVDYFRANPHADKRILIDR